MHEVGNSDSSTTHDDFEIVRSQTIGRPKGHSNAFSSPVALQAHIAILVSVLELKLEMT